MALSLDLRKRIIDATKAGILSVRKIALTFSVTEDTVYRLMRLERETGGLQPQNVGRPPLSIWTDSKQHQILRDLVEQDNQATLEEYCIRFEQHTGQRISVPQMCELFQQLKLYRKKNVPRNRRRNCRSRASPCRLATKNLAY